MTPRDSVEPSATVREPETKTKAPDWDGNRKGLEDFLDQCSLHFRLNRQRFQSGERKVLWATTYITGPPRERIRNLWASGATPDWLMDWTAFTKELRRTYGDPNPGHTARLRLNRIKQTGPVSHHVAEFKMLMSTANATDEKQLLTAFQESLRDSLRRRLLHIETTDLHEYMDAAIRMEQRLHEIGAYNTAGIDRGLPTSRSPDKNYSRPTAPPTDKQTAEATWRKPSTIPNPTQSLAEDIRRHRRKNNLCFGCGGEHQLRDCPKAKQTQALRVNTVAFDSDLGQVLLNPSETLNDELEADDEPDNSDALSYDPEASPNEQDLDSIPLWAHSISWKANVASDAPFKTEQGVPEDTLRIHRHPAIPAYECIIQLEHLKGFALVDCGATASFIAEDLLASADPPVERVRLTEPRQATMMAGKSGTITHYTELSVSLQGRVVNTTHRFYIAPVISQHDIILGMDWIEATQPVFNYKDSTLDIKVPTLDDVHAFVTQFQPSILYTPEPLSDLENALVAYRTDLRPLNTQTNHHDTPTLPTHYKEFADVFNEANADVLPPHREHDHEINLEPGSTPPHGHLYTLSQREMEELRTYLDKMIAIGFIRPSKSPAAAPILFVPKKDGRLRPCVDYRQLNAITIKDKYPIPLIAEHLDCLSTAVIFTKLDLKGAYNLLRIAKGHEWKTAFRTRYGSFEYLVMPFGLCNAPATFQRLMNHIFHDLLDISVIVYLDDILIFSNQEADHEDHVKEVLRRLRENRLYCALDKCEFSTHTVEFLGYRVHPGGIEMDPVKVETVINWPAPTSIREIQVFLGFANFYRRFIRHYSRVAAPLTERLKGKTTGKITLTDKELSAFQTLKTSFTTAPILRHFEPQLQTVIETDASDYAIAAVLSQWVPIGGMPTEEPPRPRTHRLHPVAYWSRKMQPAERNYEIHDKELLAVVDALQTWRHYLHGLHQAFEVITDHQALQYFQTKRQLNRRQARWSEALGEFVFNITYRPGSQAVRPDALTRRPDLHPNLDRHNLRADPSNVKVLLPESLFVSAAVLPPPVEKQPTPDDPQAVIRQFHDDPSAGHPGVAATLELIRRHYHWPTMRMDVEMYVKTCAACQRAKTKRHKPYGYLVPLGAPDRPFGSISMDYIEALPPSGTTTHPFNSILVVVDRLTKYVIFIPSRNTDTVKDLALSLHSRVFSYFGLPDTIVSDRGRTFVASLWTDLLRLFDVTPALSTAYHPQTDGQTERINQSLELFLRLYVNYQQDDWVSWLPFAQLAINNRSSATTGLPPTLPLFGYTPKVHPLSPPTGISGLTATADTFKNLLITCQANITAAAHRMSRHYNRSRIDRSFRRGELVLLRTKHLRVDRPSKKLANPLAGPFKIDRPVGRVAYRLDLPATWKVHPVFHVSMLEEYHTTTRSSIHAPQARTLEDNREEFEVEAILDSRWNRRRLQYLVKWVGYAKPTWEPDTNLDGATELVIEFHQQQPTKPGKNSLTTDFPAPGSP
jgi:hypothetical protein